MKKRVLIIRFSSMGDLILTTGPLAQLRIAYPALEVDLLTSEIGQELFINSVDIDRTIVLEKGSTLSSILNLYRKMPKYDFVIDLQGNFKSYCLMWFQQADFFHIQKHSKQRRAFVKSRKYMDQLNHHVVEKYYQTIRKAFPKLPDLEVEDLRPLFLPQPLTFDKKQFNFSKSVVIHPFASQKNKEWPHFADLIEKLIERNTPVVIVGHSNDNLNLPNSVLILNLVGKTTLREMASIIGSGQALITTDSGPMHVGVAVKTPTIALFGPTTKEFGFDPRFKGSWVLEEDLDCRPCHVHGGNVCPLGHHNCMKNLSVEKVLNQLDLALQQ